MNTEQERNGTITRQWRLDIPSTVTMDYHYEFDVSFKAVNTLTTVVKWSETTIGGGMFTIRDTGTLHKAFLTAWKRLAILAMAHSQLGTSTTMQGFDAGASE